MLQATNDCRSILATSFFLIAVVESIRQIVQLTGDIMLPNWVAFGAPIFIILGTINYIWNLRRRKEAVPHLITWFVWSLAPFIAFGAQLVNGGGPEIALTAVAGLCPAAIFIVGLKQEERLRFKAFDYCCGGASCVALAFWITTGSGMFGVLLSIAADAFGAVPTVRKAWRTPTSESPGFYALFAISASITLLATSQWAITTAAFSLYLLVLYCVLYLLVRFKIGLLFKKRTHFTGESLL